MRIKLSALGADSSSLGSSMSLQLPVVIGRSSTSDQLVAGIKLTFFLTLVVNFALSVLRLFECTSQVDYFKG